MTKPSDAKVIAMYCLVLELVKEKAKTKEERMAMCYALLTASNQIKDDLLAEEEEEKNHGR